MDEIWRGDLDDRAYGNKRNGHVQSPASVYCYGRRKNRIGELDELDGMRIRAGESKLRGRSHKNTAITKARGRVIDDEMAECTSQAL